MGESVQSQTCDDNDNCKSDAHGVVKVADEKRDARASEEEEDQGIFELLGKLVQEAFLCIDLKLVCSREFSDCRDDMGAQSVDRVCVELSDGVLGCGATEARRGRRRMGSVCKGMVMVVMVMDRGGGMVE
jgi:hypothetical protein